MKRLLSFTLLVALLALAGSSVSADKVDATPLFAVIYDNEMGCSLLKVNGCTIGDGFDIHKFSLEWLAKWEAEHPDRVFLSAHVNACPRLMKEKPKLPLELQLRYTFTEFYPRDKWATSSKVPEFVSEKNVISYERELCELGVDVANPLDGS